MSPFDEAWLASHNAKMARIRGEPTKPAPLLIEFSLPFLLRLPNRTTGQHWSGGHAYRKSLLGPVAQALAPWQGHHPMERARVTVCRFTTRLPDHDGNVASLKPLIDLLLVRSKVHPSSLGIIRDDDPAHLELIALAQRVTNNEHKCTTVTIEQL
jgi:hypothetical protein